MTMKKDMKEKMKEKVKEKMSSKGCGMGKKEPMGKKGK